MQVAKSQPIIPDQYKRCSEVYPREAMFAQHPDGFFGLFRKFVTGMRIRLEDKQVKDCFVDPPSHRIIACLEGEGRQALVLTPLNEHNPFFITIS